jgi:hypothetical protein
VIKGKSSTSLPRLLEVDQARPVDPAKIALSQAAAGAMDSNRKSVAPPWRHDRSPECCARQTGMHTLVVEALLIAIYSIRGTSKYLWT